MPAPSTPCIQVCVIEPATGLCVGCGRSLAEIAQWSQLAEPQRQAIMTLLPARLESLSGHPPYRPNECGVLRPRHD